MEEYLEGLVVRADGMKMFTQERVDHLMVQMVLIMMEGQIQPVLVEMVEQAALAVQMVQMEMREK
jgi:hypothetical protein